MASYYHLFNILKDVDPNQEGQMNASQKYRKAPIDRVSGFAMFSTGILLAAIRLNEPFFQYLTKKFIFNCFGEVCDPDSDGYQTKTLSSFLASSLNVELVHIILKGIKKF